MEVLENLGGLFFSAVSTVTGGAYWLVLLLVGAWLAAFLFNLLHVFLGGR